MNLKTYGEVMFYRQQNLDFTKSADELSDSLRERIPKKLEGKELFNYYNKKLYDYFLSQMDEKLGNKKELVLNHMMFGEQRFKNVQWNSKKLF